MGDEVVELRVSTEILRISVRRGEPLRTPEQQALARRALSELRHGLETREPVQLSAALRLEQLLMRGLSPFPGSELAFRAPDLSLNPERFARLAEHLSNALELEFSAGRLFVELIVPKQLRARSEPPEQPLPPRPQARRDPATTFFEVRFTDEIGQGINRMAVELVTSDGRHEITTNAGGVALLEGVHGSTAQVSVVDPNEASEILDPRWQSLRPGSPPAESNQTELVFEGGKVGPIGVKAVVPNTIVLKPPLGKIFLELWDTRGRVRHAQRDYTIQGPATFRGTTDAEGRLLHPDVLPGDYRLKLTLDFEIGDTSTSDTYESPLVVLPQTDGAPELRLIGAVPRVVLARLHMFFNTNKTFLLPTTLPAIKKLRQVYLDKRPGKLLVVGHADTRGGAAYNDKLSLERAKATIAYLEDDHDTWLGFYDAGIEAKKRWGKVEDRLMLLAMPDFVSKPKGEDSVRWYQRTRGLEVDGKAGPITRTALIKEYMTLDGAKLDTSQLPPIAHGCGENFPLDDAGEELDQKPADEKRDRLDRRVELFFFDAEFGILPAPPGANSKPGSTQYPAWRERVEETVELEAGDPDGPKLIFAELVDAHFRTDSAVVLPEGEAPNAQGEHESVSSVGVVAAALRFNEEHPGKTVLVAGHTDTTADVAYNQKLSEQRAEVALSLLRGDRAKFVSLCDARHTVADYKQILSWVATAFEDLSFDCDPGKIDDVQSTGVEPVRRFQRDFNTNKAALGSSAADLALDGSVGPLTWGAFFDCYEFALRQELGEDAAGLAALREKLVFTSKDHEFLGFSEYFPIEELGVDNFRSALNRRVEILFFDPSEEPDIEQAADDPETADLYLPGFYERAPLDPMISAKRWKAIWSGLPEKAQFNQERQMLVDAPGAPAGLPATFLIEQLVDGTPHAGPSVAGVALADRIEAPFKQWFDEAAVTHAGTMEAGAAFPKVVFRYTVEAGGRSVGSDELPYADFLRLVLRLDTDGPVAANSPFLLRSPWGTRPGKTDEEGLASADELPPGGVFVELQERFIDDPEPVVEGGSPPAPIPTRRVQLQLLDTAFEPRAGVFYTIVVDDAIFLEHKTDDQGMIDEEVPDIAARVVLQYDEDEVELRVGELPGPEQIAGIQRRLNNLGYETGPSASAMNPQTEAALRRFRADRGLGEPAAGASALDAATRDALVSLHGG
ncbi:MAG: OmpA family protein [Myxococcota bacterium]|nr:OmpA family protein [Myxococcota bacterium]